MKLHICKINRNTRKVNIFECNIFVASCITCLMHLDNVQKELNAGNVRKCTSYGGREYFEVNSTLLMSKIGLY
jgi:hypothetical protein